MELQKVKKEDAIQENILSEALKVKDVRFIESNTQAVSEQELKNQHIIPVFVKDNEQIISHQEFIDTTFQVSNDVFGNNIEAPAIRVSHPVKGRVPSAKGKKVTDLQDHEKTIYYERMSFLLTNNIITNQINGQELSLSIGGVRALNQENLYSYKGVEKFKVFIGFKVSVCTNLCISTDGYCGTIRVTNLKELSFKIRNILEQFNLDDQIQFYSQLSNKQLTEQQFAQLVGRSKLYAHLPKEVKKELPEFSFGDAMVSTIVKEYYKDDHFSQQEDGSIDLWRLYNLFTSANKNSYIDTFLDRGVNAYQFVHGINNALDSGGKHWFLS